MTVRVEVKPELFRAPRVPRWGPWGNPPPGLQLTRGAAGRGAGESGSRGHSRAGAGRASPVPHRPPAAPPPPPRPSLPKPRGRRCGARQRPERTGCPAPHPQRVRSRLGGSELADAGRLRSEDAGPSDRSRQQGPLLGLERRLRRVSSRAAPARGRGLAACPPSLPARRGPRVVKLAVSRAFGWPGIRSEGLALALARGVPSTLQASAWRGTPHPLRSPAATVDRRSTVTQQL